MGIKKTASYTTEAFKHIISTRFLIIALIIMTFLVLPVPFKYIFSQDIYQNIMVATAATNFYFLNNMLLVVHICAAIPAIIFGPFLMIPSYRKKYPSRHRLLGKIYVIGCLTSGITVLPLALNNIAGIEPRLGFSVMGILWCIITWFAYTSARHKNYVSHRRWMMRSYAMTFAFVHVNLTYKFIGVYGGLLDITGIKIMQSMVSWMSNLFLVELYLAATAVNGRWLGFKKWFYNLTHWSSADKFFLTSSKPKYTH